MLATAQEIYTQILGELSPNERLRLATLILNDLVEQPLSVINQALLNQTMNANFAHIQESV